MLKKSETGRKVLSISLPGELYNEFCSICDRQNLNRSAVLTDAVTRFVKKVKRNGANKG